VTWPVAGLKTSAARSLVPPKALPSIQWVIRVGVLMTPACPVIAPGAMGTVPEQSALR
jgi:hypothetical protein